MPAHSRATQRSAEALAEQLYIAHRTRLLAIARRNCADGEEAEEAIQDAFIFFIEHFDPDGEAPPLAWLTLYADLRVMPTLVRKPALQAKIALRRSA